MLSTAVISDEEKSNSSEDAFRRFSLAEMKLATQNFDDDLIIGKGGFGKVYKGQICTRTVAIKRLDSFSMQGAAEFMTEIEMLNEVRHDNLVSFIGFCSDENEMILVYEYMPNGTIEYHLHEADVPLSWMDRLMISIGAARGLEYLHSTQHVIIHRDVKSSNILLDENWEAKIADFGLSKIVSQPSSVVITRLKGTFGYLDLEYCNTGMLSKESDVYSFGVVLFELLSGRRAVDPSFVEEGINLATWAKKYIKERRIEQIASSHITTQISSKCLKEFVQIADRCTKSSRKERPTMGDVVVALQQAMALQVQFDSSAQASGSTSFSHKMQHLLFRSRHNSGASTSPTTPLRFSTSPKGQVHLTMKQVIKATQDFSPSLKLREGGFGTVYKAILPDGQLVAIERAQKEHFDALKIEFRSEVELLAKIDHRNLVKLLGYVDKGNECLIITEYVSNGTLREILDGVHDFYLDFSQRLGICIDIAHGLTYLHLYAEKQIIHRFIKSSNIFLTERWRAKVANFGFAILGDAETDKTKVIKGTRGYLDPVYTRTYQFTPKSDVYSFGVLLIEIITGRRPIEFKRSREEKETVKWAHGKYKKGEIMDLVDPQMKEDLDIEIIGKMLELAFQCASPKLEDRPDMKAVGEQLWVIRMHYIENGNK